MNFSTQSLAQLAPFIKLAKQAKKGDLSNHDALRAVFSFLGVDGVDVNDRASCEAAIAQTLSKYTQDGRLTKEDAKNLIDFARENSKGKKNPKDLLPIIPTIGKLVGVDPSLMSMVEIALI